MPVVLKSNKELAKMRRAGRLVAECHALVRAAIKPGVTTKELDTLVFTHLAENGGRSPFLGYRMAGAPPFPGSICASVNEVVVHGIPGPRVLEEGDIISVDIGAVLDGYVGDSAWTYPVGQIAANAQALLDVTEQCLWAALKHACAGRRLGDLGWAIQHHAESQGYSVIRALCSHGVGRRLHEDPNIPNFGKPGTGLILRSGMTMAIEPMIAEGSYDIVELDDGWTVVTKDGKLSAHFEHTIAIMPDGEPEILTQRVDE
jgi:methionyl aminopeptidase